MRLSWTFVTPQLTLGELLSSFSNGSLTDWIENRFLFMLFSLAQMGIRRLLVLNGGSLSDDCNGSLTT